MATEHVEDFDFAGGKASLPKEAVAPDGPYNLRINKAEMKQSKGSAGKPQRPMIALSTSIVGGPFEGMPVWHNLVYTEENMNAKRMFYGQLAILGIANPGSGREICAALTGRVFTASVGHREYNGVPQNTIERITALVQASPGAPSASPAPVPATAPAPQPAVAPEVPVTAEAAVPAAVPPQAEEPQPVADGGVPKPPF